ncbi:MAG: putative serine/threonine-protein kinase ATG1a, partial [Streblomastix strix]
MYSRPSELISDLSVINTLQSLEFYDIQYFDFGSFGKVYKATDRNGVVMGVKVIKEQFKNVQELEALQTAQSANSPFIIKLYDCRTIKDESYFFMNFCDRNLKKYLQDPPQKTERDAAFILYQLLSGLKTIQGLHIIHRDLKPENLMLMKVAGTDKPILQIADFGVAKKLSDEGLASTIIGTPLFMAPEQLEQLHQQNKKFEEDRLAKRPIQQYQSAPYSMKVETWASGIIFYLLCTNGTYPFENYNLDILRTKIVQPIVRPQGLSDDAWDLMQLMLQIQSQKRPTLQECLEHRFFTVLHKGVVDQVNQMLELVGARQESVQKNDSLTSSSVDTPSINTPSPPNILDQVNQIQPSSSSSNTKPKQHIIFAPPPQKKNNFQSPQPKSPGFQSTKSKSPPNQNPIINPNIFPPPPPKPILQLPF